MTLDGARTPSPAARLARLGFSDPSRAQATLDAIGVRDYEDSLVLAIREAAEPDLALDALARLLGAAPDRDALRRALRTDDGLLARLVAVLGSSTALGDHLVRHPEHWRDLVGDELTAPGPGEIARGMLEAVGADPTVDDPVAAADDETMLVTLRVAYRRRLLHLAARDLADNMPLAAVGAELADLAAGTLQAALAIARAGVRADATPCRLAVIGMGKCGGRELNYVSDVDVVFVAEPVDGADEHAALRTATRLASRVMQVCSSPSPEGSIWEVDAALRPEGKRGPLVRTLASHVAYYERWAKTWEFQALLKARPIAGDAKLGEAYIDAVAPLVWAAADRDGFVEDVQEMRRRVEAHVRPAEADRQLKLGPGGLRDVEFAVQLLQLVHGRSDEALRSPNTLEALAALAAGGYVGRADAAELSAAYVFLRRVEHRVQLHRLRRTHLMPEAEADLRRLGRSLGYQAGSGRRAHDDVATARPGSAPTARKALLQTAARRSRPPARRRRTAHTAGSAPATGGAGLRRSSGRLAAHRGAHLGTVASRGDPTDAVAGAARVVRRCTRP